MIDMDHALSKGDSDTAAVANHPSRHSAGSAIAWLLVYVLLAFGFYGARPLGEPDEGRYGEVAREMLVGGDWLVPHLEGKVHLTKPPLTYWSSAVGMKLLGVNAWGARLFVAAAFFGTILCTAALARRWGLSVAQSRAAGLVFGSSLLPFTGGHILTTDTILTFWMTLGVLCAWQVWRGKSNATPWRWGFWIAFGMAFLTKGPPGWIPLGVIGIFCAIGFSRPPRARLWSPAGLIAMLVFALWWYVLLIVRGYWATGTWDVLKHFTVGEVYDRMFTNEFKRNNSFLIYVYAVGAGIAPWVFLWPEIVKRTWKNVRGGWRNLKDSRRFAALWVAIPYVIFTLARSRMYLYVAPLMVPLSIWAGRLLPEWLERMRSWPRKGRIAVYVFACVWIFVLISIASWPDWAPRSRSQRFLARELLKNGPPPFTHLYSMDEPDLTLSFYAGLTIQEVKIDRHNILLFLDYERRNGRPSAIAIPPKDLDRIAPDVSKTEILARNKEFAVVMPK